MLEITGNNIGRTACSRMPSGKRMTRTVLAGLAALWPLFTFAAETGSNIQVENAWIRLLPANLPSGGYMTLVNSGSAPGVLISALSPDFGEVSFHQTRIKDGVSEMTAISSLTVAPRSSVQFAPGGYHLMLMQPKRTLHPGDHVPIAMRFVDGKSIEVLFEVRATDAGESSASKVISGTQH